MVVVKKQATPDASLIRKQRQQLRADLRLISKILRQEGRDYFVFFWDVDRFSKFAERCWASGTKPNDYIWGMIEKELHRLEAE